LSGTTRGSWYQKGKTNLDFTEARDSEWQWHQLGHMQVCTLLQTTTPATHHSVVVNSIHKYEEQLAMNLNDNTIADRCLAVHLTYLGVAVVEVQQRDLLVNLLQSATLELEPI